MADYEVAEVTAGPEAEMKALKQLQTTQEQLAAVQEVRSDA